MVLSQRAQTGMTRAQEVLESFHLRDFEVYYRYRRSCRIDAKEAKLENLSQSEEEGLAFRVIQNQKMGFSYTTSLESTAIQRAVASAIEVAKQMPVDPYLGFVHQVDSELPSQINPGSYFPERDEEGLKRPLKEKIEIAKELEAQCLKADKRISTVRKASLAESVFETALTNSNGVTCSQSGTSYSLSLTCKAEENGDSQVGGDFDYSPFLSQLALSSVAREAAFSATELLGAGSAPTLQCAVVLRNQLVAEILDFLSTSFFAEDFDKGKSIFSQKINIIKEAHTKRPIAKSTPLFSPLLSIYDDPSLARKAGSTLFDGEGRLAKKTALVEKGQILAFLTDSYYARKLGFAPTASSSRTLQSTPSIGSSNFFLAPGEFSQEKLLASVSRGILITDLMGLHTANPITGDFSLGASGLMIQGGRLGPPVKGFAVSGNLLKLLKQITHVGNDLRFYGGVGAPSVVVSELSIGGK